MLKSTQRKPEESALWRVLPSIQWPLLVLAAVQSFPAGPAENATMCNRNSGTEDSSRHDVSEH